MLEKIKSFIKSHSISEETFFNWFNTQKKLAFFTTLVIGILTHIIAISNTLLTCDGLWNSIYYKSGNWELSLGRWGILLAERLRTFIAIPQVTIIIGILIISISSMFLIDLFNIKKKLNIFLVSIALAVFPTLMNIFLFPYAADTYCWGVLFSILAIYMLYNCKNIFFKTFISAIFTSMAIGIYQSYLGFILGIAILIPILNLLQGKSIKNIIYEILNSIIAIFIGLIIYWIILQVLLHIQGISLASYKGAEQVSISNILTNLYMTIMKPYKTFLNFISQEEIIANSNYYRGILYFILITFVFIKLISTLLIHNYENKIARWILIIIGITILPIALDIIEIIVPNVNIYILNCYQYVLILIFAISVCEIPRIKGSKIFECTILFCVSLICYTYYLADNSSYMTVMLSENQAYSTAIRIVDRIEQNPAYTSDIKICLIGHIDNTEYSKTQKIYEKSYKHLANNSIFHSTYNGEKATWRKFLQNYLGFTYNECSKTEYEKIIQSEEFKNMPLWPNNDSIKIIDGIMIVKLTNSPAK